MQYEAKKEAYAAGQNKQMPDYMAERDLLYQVEDDSNAVTSASGIFHHYQGHRGICSCNKQIDIPAPIPWVTEFSLYSTSSIVCGIFS